MCHNHTNDTTCDDYKHQKSWYLYITQKYKTQYISINLKIMDII